MLNDSGSAAGTPDGDNLGYVAKDTFRAEYGPPMGWPMSLAALITSSGIIEAARGECQFKGTGLQRRLVLDLARLIDHLTTVCVLSNHRPPVLATFVATVCQ